nr:Asd/ArgC dimerization domain-containing protein [Verrucomicrobium spinosum]
MAHQFAVGLLAAGLRVIDLSADFRLRSAEVYADHYGHAHPSPELLAEAVYALPEMRVAEIRDARLIACPGCYPTSVLVPLLPLLKAGLLDESPIAVSSMSGVSGAGREAKTAFLFCECNESVRSYGVPRHRHVSEIGQELDLAAGRPVKFTFVPHLIPVNQASAPPSLPDSGRESLWRKWRPHTPPLTPDAPSCDCSVATRVRTRRTSPAPTSSTWAGPTTLARVASCC